MTSIARPRPLSTLALLLAGCALMLLTPLDVAAQDRGKVGLAVNAPGSVGVIWHLSDVIALLPSFDASWTSTTTDYNLDALEGLLLPNTLVDSGQTVGRITIAARLRMSLVGETRVYVSPSFSKALVSSDAGFSPLDVSSYEVSGTVGIQHHLGDRFAVFGETGVRFGHSTFENRYLLTSSLVSSTTTKTVGSTSRLGIVYYFKR